MRICNFVLLPLDDPQWQRCLQKLTDKGKGLIFSFRYLQKKTYSRYYYDIILYISIIYMYKNRLKKLFPTFFFLIYRLGENYLGTA